MKATQCGIFRRILATLKDLGWSIESTSKGHFKFISPDPTVPVAFYSGTPGDSRAIQRLRQKLRHRGVVT